MHVFIITQYFPPEVGASASRWGDFAKILVEQNHKVTILCESPHYPKAKYYKGYKNSWSFVELKSKNLNIIRSKAYASNRKSFLKKITHYITFMISAIINSNKVKDFDLLIVSSPPLFTGVIGLFINRLRKGKFWLDIRDLWPDSALELNQIRNGIFYKLGKSLETRIYSSAEGFIFPVPGFEDYLNKFSKKVSLKPKHLLMNGVSKEFINESQSLKISPNEKFTVLYSGNMGLAQDLKTIIKAVFLLKNYEIYFQFIGEGVCKSEIEQIAEPLKDKISFYKSMSRNDLIEFINRSSLCLVPLKNKPIFNSALPSKMFEYMACAKPIILGVKGEAKKIINDSRAGVSVTPENPEMLSEAILSYYNNRKKCKVDGENGLSYVSQKLLKEDLILNLIKKLKNEQSSL